MPSRSAAGKAPVLPTAPAYSFSAGSGRDPRSVTCKYRFPRAHMFPAIVNARSPSVCERSVAGSVFRRETSCLSSHLARFSSIWASQPMITSFSCSSLHDHVSTCNAWQSWSLTTHLTGLLSWQQVNAPMVKTLKSRRCINVPLRSKTVMLVYSRNAACGRAVRSEGTCQSPSFVQSTLNLHCICLSAAKPIASPGSYDPKSTFLSTKRKGSAPSFGVGPQRPEPKGPTSLAPHDYGRVAPKTKSLAYSFGRRISGGKLCRCSCRSSQPMCWPEVLCTHGLWTPVPLCTLLRTALFIPCVTSACFVFRSA